MKWATLGTFSTLPTWVTKTFNVDVGVSAVLALAKIFACMYVRQKHKLM
jgi:hypothetical protein